MDFEDLLTSLDIWKFYRDPPVKTSRTEKCRVQGIRAVCCGKDHNTLGAVKTIHLCQKLVQCLLTLIVTACESGTVTLLTNGIDLIDEDNTRCFLIRLFKKVTDLGGTHTNKHLYKLRTGDREKWYFCLTCNSLGKKGLTCSWRAYKEGTFWHGSSDLCIFVRIVEIVNDLCQKLLRLVLSCHIRKLDPCG